MARPSIIACDGEMLSERELLARLFRTLGDGNRLRILELLVSNGSMTQSQLIETLGITQSRASEHLSCLVWCGLVRSERRGRTVNYEVCDWRSIALVDLARGFLAASQAECQAHLAHTAAPAVTEGDGVLTPAR